MTIKFYTLDNKLIEDTLKFGIGGFTGIVEYNDGSREWRFNSILHRLDGPAVVCGNGSKLWYVHGKFHRIDGPAVENCDGTKGWWINGINCSYQEHHALLVDIMKLKGLL